MFTKLISITTTAKLVIVGVAVLFHSVQAQDFPDPDDVLEDSVLSDPSPLFDSDSPIDIDNSAIDNPIDIKAVTTNTLPEGIDGGSNTVVFRILLNGKKRTVVLDLDPILAPRTVANFRKLVEEGFYDGLAFHRVLPGLLVQTGDPQTLDESDRLDWGTGGPGYTIPAETGGMHTYGSVAMARLGSVGDTTRASNGSQFYVCLRSLRPLDGKYTVFGKVVRGMDVIKSISNQTSDNNDVPDKRVEIVSASLGDRDRAIKLAESSNKNIRTQPAPVLQNKKSSNKTVKTSKNGKNNRFVANSEDELRASTAPRKLRNKTETGFIRKIW